MINQATIWLYILMVILIVIGVVIILVVGTLQRQVEELRVSKIQTGRQMGREGLEAAMCTYLDVGLLLDPVHVLVESIQKEGQ